MARKPRMHYTETDKVVMWDRWRKGDSLEKIAQLIDRGRGSRARILLMTPLLKSSRLKTASELAAGVGWLIEENCYCLWLSNISA